MKKILFILFFAHLLVCFCFLLYAFAAITDEELQRGMSSEEIEEVPVELLLILKDYFPREIVDDSVNDADFFEPYFHWDYGFADLDGAGTKDYLVIVYTNGFLTSLKILKKENDLYNFVWESSSSSYLDSGITEGFELVDVDNDGRPEIQVRQHSFGGNPAGFNEPLFLWTNSEEKLITPCSDEVWTGEYELIDLDRNGTLEMVTFDYDEQRDAPQRKVYSLSGEGYILDRIIEYDDNRSFSLSAAAQVEPQQWDLKWANLAQNARMKNIRIIINGIDEDHAVDEIDLSSLRLEERISPLQTVVEDNKLIAEFDKREVMAYLLEFPRKDPLHSGDKIDIAISALLQESGQYVSGSCEVEIIESLDATVEIHPDKWNIHWLKKDEEHPGDGKIKCYLGNITEHTINDVVVETVLLNDTAPVSEHSKFEGEILEVKFNKFQAVESLGEINLEDTVGVIVTGKLSDGKTFIGENTIQIIGYEPEEEKK